jgi:hypothetical protein
MLRVCGLREDHRCPRQIYNKNTPFLYKNSESFKNNYDLLPAWQNYVNMSCQNVSHFYFESFKAVWAQSKFSKCITLNIIFLNFSDVLWFRILSAVFVEVRVGCGACFLWLTSRTIRVKQSHGVSEQFARCLFNWVTTECWCSVCVCSVFQCVLSIDRFTSLQ